jgi:hypothetical protein
MKDREMRKAVEGSYQKLASADTSGQIIGYEIVDRTTKNVIKKYGPDQGAAATRFVDKKDTEYGASRYTRRAIWSE